jgi:hypothetical protein
MLGGVPFGPGLIADEISSQLGRPLAVNLGPSVLDLEDESGQVIGSTHTGGGMTVHDDNDPNTQYGVSPALGIIGNSASVTAPTRRTLTGVDPAPPEPTPEQPAPTPELPDIDGPMTPPDGVNVDPGNTGLQANDLAGLFQRMGNRVYKGKNAGRIVT